MENLALQREEPIFEVSKYTPKNLKSIEKLFNQLKKSPFDIYVKKQLVDKIKSFTKINQVTFSVKKNFFNASVLPIYNQNLSKSISNIIKDFKGHDFNQSIEPLKLKKMTSLEESSDYIKKIFIVFGEPLVEQFSAAELTAILLHEIGHVYMTTSNAPTIILNSFKEIMTLTSKILGTISIGSIAIGYKKIFELGSSSFLIFILLILTQGITFLERLHEKAADNFAIKYGYGIEILTTIKFLDNIGKRERSKKNLLIKIFTKIVEILKDIFSPSSHPSPEKRIKDIENQIKKNCIEIYPDLSTELSVILKDYEYA